MLRAALAAVAPDIAAQVRRDCADELAAAETWDEVWELTDRWSAAGRAAADDETPGSP